MTYSKTIGNGLSLIRLSVLSWTLGEAKSVLFLFAGTHRVFLLTSDKKPASIVILFEKQLTALDFSSRYPTEFTAMRFLNA